MIRADGLDEKINTLHEVCVGQGLQSNNREELVKDCFSQISAHRPAEEAREYLFQFYETLAHIRLDDSGNPDQSGCAVLRAARACQAQARPIDHDILSKELCELYSCDELEAAACLLHMVPRHLLSEFIFHHYADEVLPSWWCDSMLNERTARSEVLLARVVAGRLSDIKIHAPRELAVYLCLCVGLGMEMRVHGMSAQLFQDALTLLPEDSKVIDLAQKAWLIGKSGRNAGKKPTKPRDNLGPAL